LLEQIPPEDRTEIRAVGIAMWLGLLERRLDNVQAAAALTRTFHTPLSCAATECSKILAAVAAVWSVRVIGKTAAVLLVARIFCTLTITLRPFAFGRPKKTLRV
jgi:hypothetical protein